MSERDLSPVSQVTLLLIARPLHHLWRETCCLSLALNLSIIACIALIIVLITITPKPLLLLLTLPTTISSSGVLKVRVLLLVPVAGSELGFYC